MADSRPSPLDFVDEFLDRLSGGAPKKSGTQEVLNVPLPNGRRVRLLVSGGELDRKGIERLIKLLTILAEDVEEAETAAKTPR